MRKTKILFLSIFSMLIILSSCKKDDPINEAKVLADYVEANFNVATLPAYIHASSINGGVGLADLLLTSDPYVIDIRSAAKWAAGHISTAINVDISVGESVVEHCKTNSATIGDRDIIVVCYSGQSAAMEVALLKLSGFSKAKSLLFGMSSWTSVQGYDSWTANISNDHLAVKETASNPKGSTYKLPVINTGFETGADILADRIAEVEAAGFGALSTTGAMTVSNRDSWYLINYWKEADYTNGHIEGAIMYDPTATVNPLTQAADLLTLPSDLSTTIIVYCYSGQTSAFIATYLNVLGYTNVKTMKFGVNSLWEATMPGTRWLAYKDANLTDKELIVE
jgi:rhodanese-related sulfurtransferase